MTKPRKNVSVDRVRELANNYFANANSDAVAREAIMSLVECVLMETGNYAGYRYLDLDAYKSNVDGAGSRVEYF